MCYIYPGSICKVCTLIIDTYCSVLTWLVGYFEVASALLLQDIYLCPQVRLGWSKACCGLQHGLLQGFSERWDLYGNFKADADLCWCYSKFLLSLHLWDAYTFNVDWGIHLKLYIWSVCCCKLFSCCFDQCLSDTSGLPWQDLCSKQRQGLCFTLYTVYACKVSIYLSFLYTITKYCYSGGQEVESVEARADDAIAHLDFDNMDG